MLSHNGRCCVGINSDAAAINEPELLFECLLDGIDDVLTLGKPDNNKPINPEAAAPRPARKSARPTKPTEPAAPTRKVE